MVELDYPPKYYSKLFMGETVPISEQSLDGVYWHNVDYLIRHDQVQLQHTLWGKLVGYMNRRRLELDQILKPSPPPETVAREQLTFFDGNRT